MNHLLWLSLCLIVLAGCETGQSVQVEKNDTEQTILTKTSDVEAAAAVQGLPGRLEVEEYHRFSDYTSDNEGGAYRSDAVDIEGTQDDGGGYDVGWIQDGEWLEYDVSIAESGQFDLALRMASGSSGNKTATVEVDGNQVASFNLTKTEGWQAWHDVVVENVSLTEGTHTLRIVMKSNSFNLNYLEVTAKNSGTVHTLPGKLEVEEYTDFSDFTSGNSGGAYRSDDVDVEATQDAGGGYDVGWVQDGEWLEYTVSVVESGSYDLTLRMASGSSGNKTATVSTDGQQVASFTLTKTEGWQAWKDVVVENVQFSSGTQTLRISMKSNSFNVNYLEVVAASGNSGEVHELPGRLEVEEYSDYSDYTSGNAGGAYRSDDVDVESTADAGGGYDIGWIQSGEWLEYDVSVIESGKYDLTLRMASGSSGSKTAMVLVGGERAGSFTLTRTDGWQAWQDVNVYDVQLSAGKQTLRIEMNSTSFNLNYLDVKVASGIITPPSEMSMKVVNWNVHYKNKNTRGLANIIGETDADIVGLCEFTASVQTMASDISSATGRNFRVQPGRDYRKGYGTDIFYDDDKWDALDGGAETVYCPGTTGGDRAANWVVLQDEETGNVVVTGGIHLTYCGSGCDATQECELSRMYEIFESKKAQYDAPVIWMGDLNLGLHSRVVQNLLKGTIGSKRTFEVEDVAQTVGNTYYSGGSAIDHILAEPGYFERISGGRTGHGTTGQLLEGADHFPVYTHIRWAE